MTNFYKIATMSAALLSLTACTSLAKATGAKKTRPNEFNILTKAPLVVPPEYNLRPPAAGEARTEDIYSSKVAREALIGEIDSTKPSKGELLLMNKANVAKANPEVRILIDGENSVERKSGAFTERLLAYGTQAEGVAAPMDAEQEANRLKAITSATGGGEVKISKRPTGRKLPGL